MLVATRSENWTDPYLGNSEKIIYDKAKTQPQ
jgi:hypothetical protein